MAVANDGSFCGTIGGGIMEHKLVEKAKALLPAEENSISLVRQYHDKAHSKDQSGMICSGSQWIAFVPFSYKDKSLVDIILAAQAPGKFAITLSPSGITVDEKGADEFAYKNDSEWRYTEKIDSRPIIHIIGGGHVGLALSELMNFLGFYIHVYDNRPYLNTMNENRFAHQTHLVDYNNIGEIIAGAKDEYVVIVTFGYRDDKIVFRQLLDKDFFYLGMMGSDKKIETLFAELEGEGISPGRWKHSFVPVGLPIYSKTTQEIAVSIAAQIIREKNKGLPTGRNEKEE